MPRSPSNVLPRGQQPKFPSTTSESWSIAPPDEFQVTWFIVAVTCGLRILRHLLRYKISLILALLKFEILNNRMGEIIYRLIR